MNLSIKLLNWYSDNKRDLPWRNTKEPYLVWLSEIILQQTRVQQGLPYYLKFVDNYPTVNHLANANEEAILKDWQGLGYYSRARNMHHTAKLIVSNFKGQFPSTIKKLKELKGIGDYTSAAIGSICFNLPEPAIDGNVYRVVSRIFGIEIPIDSKEGKKIIKSLTKEYISKQNPGDFNQAMMDFGSLQCTPSNPNCLTCPFSDNCIAYRQDKTKQIPLKSKKVIQKNRYFNYFVLINRDQSTIIKKRTSNDIWKNLFDFPLLETEATTINFPDLIENSPFLKKLDWTKVELTPTTKEYKHILTHQIIYAKFWELKFNEKINLDNPLKMMNFKDTEQYAFPKLIENYINNRCVELI